MPTQWTRARVARLVDHTLLKPEATEADVESLVRAALALDVFAVCVSPSMITAASRAISTAASRAIGTAASRAAGPALTIATVVGFPSGKHLSEIKAHEAGRAVLAGATEVDMVIDVGAALSGAVRDVHDDVSAVRQAVPDALLKVIVESAVLLEFAGESTLRDVCTAAADAGADFVKTSTGFHPAGGASMRAVELMAAAAGPAVAVKASGGIRTAADAIAMLEAGATRLGLSGTRAVLDGLA